MERKIPFENSICLCTCFYDTLSICKSFLLSFQVLVGLLELFCVNKVVLDEIIQNDSHAILDRDFVSLDVDIRLFGCFVRSGNASEFLDFTSLGFLV